MVHSWITGAFEAVLGVLGGIESDLASGVSRVDGPAEETHPNQWTIHRMTTRRFLPIRLFSHNSVMLTC
jgi:hypothetical protein